MLDVFFFWLDNIIRKFTFSNLHFQTFIAQAILNHINNKKITVLVCEVLFLKQIFY